MEVSTRNRDGGNAAIGNSSLLNNNNVGRVASWAVSFENLLQDEDGVKAFSVSVVSWRFGWHGAAHKAGVGSICAGITEVMVVVVGLCHYAISTIIITLILKRKLST